MNEHSFTGTGALSHLGIQVASTKDVLTIREQWHQRGLFTRGEMQSDCCFATQKKTWVLDPDGNQWEVFVVLKDKLPENGEVSSSCCVPVCCDEHANQQAAANCACTAATS